MTLRNPSQGVEHCRAFSQDLCEGFLKVEVARKMGAERQRVVEVLGQEGPIFPFRKENSGIKCWSITTKGDVENGKRR
jgi:hypothetical protein